MNFEDASPLQIVIAGLSGSGKTTFTQRFRNLEADVLVQPTMGIDVHVESQFGIKFFLYDLGGHENFFETIWPITLPKANAIIYIFDSAFIQNARTVRENFMTVLRHVNDVPVLILANKQDLPFAKTIEELEEEIGFNQLLKQKNITNSKMFGVSALRGDGVSRAIDWLVHQVFKLMKLKVPQIHEIYVYNRHSGLPLAYLHPNAEDMGIVDKEADQATLVSAFYAALTNFSNDIMQSNVQALTLRQASSSSNDRKELLLLNYNDEDTSLSCLIVADAHDDNNQLEKMAKIILDDLKKKPHLNEQLTGTLLDLRFSVLKALNVIHPESEDVTIFLAREHSWINSFGITEKTEATPEKNAFNEDQAANRFTTSEDVLPLNDTSLDSRDYFILDAIEPRVEETSDESDEYLEAFRKLSVLEKAAELKRRRKRRIF